MSETEGKKRKIAMNKRIKNILLGISDGLFPGVKNSIEKTNKGQMEINHARLIAAVLTWGCFIAVLKGWLTLSMALDFISAIAFSTVE